MAWTPDLIRARKKLADFNGLQKVGTVMVCPFCGEIFTKRTYGQKFCRTLCKDRFRNTVNAQMSVL